MQIFWDMNFGSVRKELPFLRNSAGDCLQILNADYQAQVLGSAPEFWHLGKERTGSVLAGNQHVGGSPPLSMVYSKRCTGDPPPSRLTGRSSETVSRFCLLAD